MANKKNDLPNMNELNAENENNQPKAESRFSKEQLVSAVRFRGMRDILNALLSADNSYTMREAEQIIEKFLKGQVK